MEYSFRTAKTKRKFRVLEFQGQLLTPLGEVRALPDAVVAFADSPGAELVLKTFADAGAVYSVNTYGNVLVNVPDANLQKIKALERMCPTMINALGSWIQRDKTDRLSGTLRNHLERSIRCKHRFYPNFDFGEFVREFKAQTALFGKEMPDETLDQAVAFAILAKFNTHERGE